MYIKAIGLSQCKNALFHLKSDFCKPVKFLECYSVSQVNWSVITDLTDNNMNVQIDKKLIKIIVLHNSLKPLSTVYLRKRASFQKLKSLIRHFPSSIGKLQNGFSKVWRMLAKLQMLSTRHHNSNSTQRSHHQKDTTYRTIR